MIRSPQRRQRTIAPKLAPVDIARRVFAAIRTGIIFQGGDR